MRFALLLCLILFFCPEAAHANGKGEIPSIFIREGDQHAVAQRDFEVELGQRSIDATYDIGRVASDFGGGGALGGLYWSGRYNKDNVVAARAARRADAQIAPLREQLADFDVGALATEAAHTALTTINWFHPGMSRLELNPTIDSRILFAGIATTQQIAFVSFRYELSHDATHIRVVALVVIVETSLLTKPRRDQKPLFQQQIVSIVELRKRSFDPRQNVAQWSANRAALARAALQSAFAAYRVLIPRALAMSQQDVIILNDKGHERAQGAGFYGPILDRSPDKLLIWTNGLTLIQPASDPS